MSSITAFNVDVTEVKRSTGKNGGSVLTLKCAEKTTYKDQTFTEKYFMKLFGLIANTDIKAGDVISYTGGKNASEKYEGKSFNYVSLGGLTAAITIARESSGTARTAQPAQQQPQQQSRQAPAQQAQMEDDDIPF